MFSCNLGGFAGFGIVFCVMGVFCCVLVGFGDFRVLMDFWLWLLIFAITCVLVCLWILW